MKIFLSHSNKNKQNINTFKKSLHKDIKTWIDDEELVWGDDLEITFSSAIKTEVDFLVVFLSEHALGSKWVEKELNWAFQREDELKRTFVLPVLFRDVDRKKIPTVLKGRKYLELDGYETKDFKNLANDANKDIFSIIVRSYSSLTSNLIDFNQFFVKSYPVSNDINFIDDVIKRIEKAKNITMVGLCVNLLWRNEVVDILVNKVKSNNANVRLCLSNPENKEVQKRTWEEFCDMTCQGSTKVTILYIWKNIKELIENNKASKDFLRIFEGVPKFAVIVIDEDIFFYPYGHKISGLKSPIFQLRNNRSKEASFFIDAAENIIKESSYVGDVVNSWI